MIIAHKLILILRTGHIVKFTHVTHIETKMLVLIIHGETDKDLMRANVKSHIPFADILIIHIDFTDSWTNDYDTVRNNQIKLRQGNDK